MTLNNILDLNIILPVHNEVKSIEKVLKEWKDEVDKLEISYEFVICEDGSTDGTKNLLTNLKDSYPIKLSQEDTQRGYGKAVIDGIRMANSQFVLCIDSDGQCNPNDFSEFWRNKDTADVLIGWRTNRQDTFLRKLYSGSFKKFFNMLFSPDLHDPSAPFVLFQKQKIINNLNYLYFLQEGFWWGFVAMCYKKKLVIKELPINHRLRIDGGTRVFIFSKILNIALRNLVGLVKLKLAK
ncbi:MAG: glycosyltransferase family 2 protein [Thermodesulfovibrionia bacterium]|nr:glycosyltransferase family 2 protein [Thermodesulfovibrionia bacterium]